jgi:hypothetical protein
MLIFSYRLHKKIWLCAAQSQIGLKYDCNWLALSAPIALRRHLPMVLHFKFIFLYAAWQNKSTFFRKM